MAKGLYESMNSGLDNLIKSTMNEGVLTEKKQKISPEDARDNELIRSAMLKRHNRENAALTKEEKDALERNGWSVSGRDFSTANGRVYVPKEYSKPRIYNNSVSDSGSYASGKTRAALTSKYVDYKAKKKGGSGYEWRTREIEPNVNFANMGRKQKERAENSKYGDYRVGNIARNNPIHRSATDRHYSSALGRDVDVKGDLINKDSWEVNDAIQNGRNRLAKERFGAEQMIKGSDAIRQHKKYRDSLESTGSSLEWDYDRYDRDKEEYRKKIEYYKGLLAELEQRIKRYEDSADKDTKEYRNKIKNNLEQRRAEFNARKTKSESLNRVHRKRIAESKNTSKGKRV